MSTQFTLYALDENQLDAARQQMAGSLGYGNTDFASIHDAAARNQAALMSPGPSSFDVYRASSIVIDNDHTTLHDDDAPCLAHRLVEVIGHELPVIGHGLIRRVRETFPSDAPADAYVSAERLDAWLEGARGRRLWYVFA